MPCVAASHTGVAISWLLVGCWNLKQILAGFQIPAPAALAIPPYCFEWPYCSSWSKSPAFSLTSSSSHSPTLYNLFFVLGNSSYHTHFRTQESVATKQNLKSFAIVHGRENRPKMHPQWCPCCIGCTKPLTDANVERLLNQHQTCQP